MSVCNSKSYDNEMEVVYRQLLREVRELEQTTEATLLRHDGKIAELCLYIKNNLSNSVRDLLDALQHSGELDSIITSAIGNKIELLEDAVYPHGNIKRYSAVGDGITNDTNALRLAIEDAKAHNLPLVIEEGKYLITEDINAKYIKTVDIKGEIVTNTGNVVEVGGDSSDASGYRIDIRKVKYLKVTGLKNSIINVDNCEKLHLFANGDDASISSIGYCTFSGAFCGEVILEGVGTSSLAWINENLFNIKRINTITIKGEYDHNNNMFNHVNFERGTLNLDGARNNYISARCEGGVTINSTERSQANFLEKEFYYRHYFGDSIQEDANGTVTYFPVHKLQTEIPLKKIDRYNRKFPIGTMGFNEDGTFTGKQYNTIFRSNLIPITNTFALKMKSDKANFRVQLKFYDENKNPIITEVDNFADGRMKYVSGAEWTYTIQANVSEDTVVFYPGYAKYVEYQVLFGTANANIEYLTVKLVKYTDTDISVTDTLDSNVYTAVPTSYYWERGTILYAKSPAPNSSIGIVCVESGTPGVWKNWGVISN